MSQSLVMMISALVVWGQPMISAPCEPHVSESDGLIEIGRFGLRWVGLGAPTNELKRAPLDWAKRPASIGTKLT